MPATFPDPILLFLELCDDLSEFCDINDLKAAVKIGAHSLPKGGRSRQLGAAILLYPAMLGVLSRIYQG